MDKFEKLQKQLHNSIEKYGLNSEKTRKISDRYNRLVNSYYEKEKQYHEGELMQIKYQESMIHIKKITKDFVKFPSVDEWNQYAKKSDLLSSESIKYISGNNWHNLRNRIMSEI